MPPPRAGQTPRQTPQHRSGLEPLPAVRLVPPLDSFDDVSEYASRHRNAVNMEHEFERREIGRFNAELLEFRAFPMITIRRGRSSGDILLFVEPRTHDSMLPKEDESCKVNIPGVGSLDATRKENPCSSWGVHGHYWDRHLVFEVTLPGRFRNSITPFFPGPERITGNMVMPQPHQIQPKNITFELRFSWSTMNAELTALGVMTRAVTENQVDMQAKANAMKYILNFRRPTNFVNLFTYFPHMTNPDSLPRTVSPELARAMRALNSHQRDAYISLLSNIPAGVAILAGCPGAGKTHFFKVLVAALQSTDEMVFSGERMPRPHRNTALILCDINKPATDIANKIHEWYRQLRLTRLNPSDGQSTRRVVVRMYCWSYEKKSLRLGRLQAEYEQHFSRIRRGDRNPMSGASGFAGGPATSNYNPVGDESQMVDVHRFSLPFLRAGASNAASNAFRIEDLQESNVAPTLDQFARADYERHKDTEYSRLRSMLRGVDTENIDMTTVISFAVESEIEKVYRNALHKIDLLVMTPVTASKFSDALANIFKPALVIFDEAPHAREASTLIPIAKFDPVAWIFTGDHRQMKPWVGSYKRTSNINKHALQLRLSFMERAHDLGLRGPALMINHRAFGDLHQLPSRLFYDSRMISYYNQVEHGLLPYSVDHVRNSYIMRMKRNSGGPVSRLLVVLPDAGPPVNMQDSWCHPGHQRWVKNLVTRLLQDGRFTKPNSDERGTILIMAPYRAATTEYRKLIKELRNGRQRLDTSRVDARTVDTAQGHESDFSILDLVRDRVTDHLDDRHRLCVGLTRARQAEVILMHEGMLRQLRGNNSFSRGTLAEVVRHCEQAGEVVRGPASLD